MSNTTDDRLYMGIFYREETEDMCRGCLMDSTSGYFDIVATTDMDTLRHAIKRAKSIDSSYHRDPRRQYVGDIEFLIAVDGKLAYRYGLQQGDTPAFDCVENCADISTIEEIKTLVEAVEAEIAKHAADLSLARIAKDKAAKDIELAQELTRARAEYEQLKKLFEKD